MAARFLLILLLIMHPARGLLAAGPDRAPTPPTPTCAADGCCPLCAALPACPCDAAPAPDDDPAPAVPPTLNDLPRLVAAGPSPVWLDAAPAPVRLAVAGPRAPPASPARPNEFLSIVCVWTT